MTCMSGIPLSIEEVDEASLLRVRATVERVERLIDRVAELKGGVPSALVRRAAELESMLERVINETARGTISSALRDEAIALVTKDWGDDQTDYITSLKAIIAKNHNRDLGLMRERDEALRAYIDAQNVGGLVRLAADQPRASGKRDGFTRPTEAQWRQIVTLARGGK